MLSESSRVRRKSRKRRKFLSKNTVGQGQAVINDADLQFGTYYMCFHVADNNNGISNAAWQHEF